MVEKINPVNDEKFATTVSELEPIINKYKGKKEFLTFVRQEIPDLLHKGSKASLCK